MKTLIRNSALLMLSTLFLTGCGKKIKFDSDLVSSALGLSSVPVQPI